MAHMDDKVIAMRTRHVVAKSALDISEMTVTCHRGVVELCGKLKRPRGFVGNMNIKKEFEALKEMARHTHGVRDLVCDRVQLLD